MLWFPFRAYECILPAFKMTALHGWGLTKFPGTFPVSAIVRNKSHLSKCNIYFISSMTLLVTRASSKQIRQYLYTSEFFEFRPIRRCLRYITLVGFTRRGLIISPSPQLSGRWLTPGKRTYRKSMKTVVNINSTVRFKMIRPISKIYI